MNTLSKEIQLAIVPQKIHQEFYEHVRTDTQRWDDRHYIDIDGNGSYDMPYSNSIELPINFPTRFGWQNVGTKHPITGEFYPEITRSIYLPSVSDLSDLINFNNAYDIRDKLLRDGDDNIISGMWFRDVRGDDLNNTMAAYSDTLCTLDG